MREEVAPPQLVPSQIALSNDQFTILVVDDEPINLQVVANHLSLQNYAIIKANNGIEALAKIESGLRPELSVLDVMMAKMSPTNWLHSENNENPAFDPNEGVI